jgi:hypothetical protein
MSKLLNIFGLYTNKQVKSLQNPNVQSVLTNGSIQTFNLYNIGYTAKACIEVISNAVADLNWFSENPQVTEIIEKNNIYGISYKETIKQIISWYFTTGNGLATFQKDGSKLYYVHKNAGLLNYVNGFGYQYQSTLNQSIDIKNYVHIKDLAPHIDDIYNYYLGKPNVLNSVIEAIEIERVYYATNLRMYNNNFLSPLYSLNSDSAINNTIKDQVRQIFRRKYNIDVLALENGVTIEPSDINKENQTQNNVMSGSTTEQVISQAFGMSSVLLNRDFKYDNASYLINDFYNNVVRHFANMVKDAFNNAYQYYTLKEAKLDYDLTEAETPDEKIRRFEHYLNTGRATPQDINLLDGYDTIFNVVDRVVTNEFE